MNGNDVSVLSNHWASSASLPVGVSVRFDTMPHLATARSRERERHIMQKYVEIALFYLKEKEGSTVNAILRYLEKHCDDESVRDTVTVFPILWGALSAGMDSNRILIDPTGHRYRLDPEVEANLAVKARKYREKLHEWCGPCEEATSLNKLPYGQERQRGKPRERGGKTEAKMKGAKERRSKLQQ